MSCFLEVIAFPAARMAFTGLFNTVAKFVARLKLTINLPRFGASQPPRARSDLFSEDYEDPYISDQHYINYSTPILFAKTDHKSFL